MQPLLPPKPLLHRPKKLLRNKICSLNRVPQSKMIWFPANRCACAVFSTDANTLATLRGCLRFVRLLHRRMHLSRSETTQGSRKFTPMSDLG